MARLRHFAVCVKDLEKAAKFYENVFELKRIGREDLDIGSAIYMSDGVINLALLNFTGAAGSKASDLKDPGAHVGAHHFGFQVDDLAETQRRIEANGGKFFFDLGEERHGNFERKFKDPDGVIFDISKHGWQGTDGYGKGGIVLPGTASKCRPVRIPNGWGFGTKAIWLRWFSVQSIASVLAPVRP